MVVENENSGFHVHSVAMGILELYKQRGCQIVRSSTC
jgi:hypothetical protein